MNVTYNQQLESRIDPLRLAFVGRHACFESSFELFQQRELSIFRWFNSGRRSRGDRSMTGGHDPFGQTFSAECSQNGRRGSGGFAF